MSDSGGELHFSGCNFLRLTLFLRQRLKFPFLRLTAKFLDVLRLTANPFDILDLIIS